MKRSTKAALISALIFPGAGHLYLKKYLAGTVLASVTFASLYYLLEKTVESATQIVEQMQTTGGQLDVTAISELAARQPAGNDALLLNIASMAILVCWVVGIVDSYRAGAKKHSV